MIPASLCTLCSATSRTDCCRWAHRERRVSRQTAPGPPAPPVSHFSRACSPRTLHRFRRLRDSSKGGVETGPCSAEAAEEVRRGVNSCVCGHRALEICSLLDLTGKIPAACGCSKASPVWSVLIHPIGRGHTVNRLQSVFASSLSPALTLNVYEPSSPWAL